RLLQKPWPLPVHFRNTGGRNRGVCGGGGGDDDGPQDLLEVTHSILRGCAADFWNSVPSNRGNSVDLRSSNENGRNHAARIGVSNAMSQLSTNRGTAKTSHKRFYATWVRIWDGNHAPGHGNSDCRSSAALPDKRNKAADYADAIFLGGTIAA